jgi:FkbM family methyltransferase
MLMDQVVGRAKNLALNLLPRSVLFYLKAARYTRLVGVFSEAIEPELGVVKYLVRAGDTVVDVGANVGWYTKYMAGIVGAQGRVISLEPMRETFALLSKCMKGHSLTNVVLHNVGASECDGVGTMEVPQYASGGENYYMARLVESARGVSAHIRQEVKLRSLDSLLGGAMSEVEFIKCDVEGHELQLIKGARKIIKLRKASWLIEIARSSDPDTVGSKSAQVFGLLGAEKYSPWWLSGGVLRRRQKGDKALNYFFLLPEHVSILEQSRLVMQG